MKNIAKPILLVSGIVVTLLFTGTVLGYASNNEDGNGTLENPIAVVCSNRVSAPYFVLGDL